MENELTDAQRIMLSVAVAIKKVNKMLEVTEDAEERALLHLVLGTLNGVNENIQQMRDDGVVK